VSERLRWSQTAESVPEPWLRGTMTEVHAVHRAAVHALELAQEDIHRWCGALTDEELNASPLGLPPVAFQLRHIARSLDRLLTYAEGGDLTPEQSAALKTEHAPGATRDILFEEFAVAMGHAAQRLLSLQGADLDEPRYVGRKKLPTTLGGLIVHVADHTQRHVGQVVTTSRVVGAMHAK
jgi:uncharacterized damage-inducible protein DinB